MVCDETEKPSLTENQIHGLLLKLPLLQLLSYDHPTTTTRLYSFSRPLDYYCY